MIARVTFLNRTKNVLNVGTFVCPYTTHDVKTSKIKLNESLYDLCEIPSRKYLSTVSLWVVQEMSPGEIPAYTVRVLIPKRY